MFMKKLSYGVSAAALLLGAASAVHAQETTGTIRGQVVDATGAGVANAAVRVVHTPSGTASNVVTSSDGYYSARGLRAGGPYSITVTSASGQTAAATLGSVSIGDPAAIDIVLGAQVADGATSLEDVIVTGTAAQASYGSSSNFGEGRIQNLPSISRDLKDVARLDPFAVINDPDNQDSMSFAGTNTRYNQVTVDGIRQSDDFGLNNNGYPTQRSPISLDAVETVQVSVAPFSVINNGFLGGSINAVTKSGTNEFHGSAFYEYSSDEYRGDEANFARGPQAGVPFEETTWGVSLGGPILQDRLFFFGSYEKFEGQFNLDEGPAGSGAPIEIGRITEAAINRFREDTQRVYGYDPGSWVNGAPPVNDEKILGKIDWNINDSHRLALTYQRTLGNSFNGSVSSTYAQGNSTSNTNPAIGLESRQYNKSERLDQYTAQLNSDWTQNFSTELRFGYKHTETTQLPLQGLEVGQVQVTVAGAGAIGANDLPGVLPGTGTPSNQAPRIQFGADQSRHDNYLDVKTTNVELIGRYSLAEHDFLFGARSEHLDINNVFVASSLGSWQFSSYANYLAGIVQSFSLTGAVDPTGGTVPATLGTARQGAAEFDYRLNSIYAEDTWQANDVLSLQFGARIDWYAMDDMPVRNAAFEARNGFSNQQNLDGKSVFLPRMGFRWDAPYDVDVSGGVGRFSSQGLNVWLSNPFANDGARVVNARCTGPIQVTSLKVAPSNCTFTPGDGNTNVMDPDLKIPTVWKTNLSVGRDFAFPVIGDDWRLQADLIYQNFENSLIQQDIRAIVIGYAPDGRPVYGRRPVAGGTANEFDMMLTNAGEGGTSFSTALTASKRWYDGWAEGLSFSSTYTYTEAEDRNPLTSSIALSSYTRFASADHNNPELATSDYEIRHRFAVNVGWTRALFGDYESSVNMFAQHRSGLPFSYTFHNARPGGNNDKYDVDFGNSVSSYSGSQATSNQLLYVPGTDSAGNVTATSDARVTYAAGFDVAAFNELLHKTGLIDYAGGIAPRNGFRTDAVTTVDLRFSQELPAFFPGGAKLKAYLDIENFGNLLNDEWGVLEQYTFYRGVPVVDVNCTGGCANASQYTYSNLQRTTGTTDPIRPYGVTNASLWQIKFGLRYSF